MNKILIFGTGAFGTTIANILLTNNNYVAMYGIDQKEINDLLHKQNTKYFGNFKLIKKPNIVTNNLATLSKIKFDFVILAVPSLATTNIVHVIKKYITNKPILINCIKGLNEKTNQPWSLYLKNSCHNNFKAITSLIGPGFAKEIIKGATTVVNIVSNNKLAANKVIKLLSTKTFICKYCHDLSACYLASFKNPVAIMTGLLSGLKYSINTIAAFFTIAIKEINQIINTKNKISPSIIEYCGIGDLFLTCSKKQSRNFKFGLSIAKYGAKKALLINKTTVEGLSALKVIHNITMSNKEKYPLFTNLFEVIFYNKNPINFVQKVLISNKNNSEL